MRYVKTAKRPPEIENSSINEPAAQAKKAAMHDIRKVNAKKFLNLHILRALNNNPQADKKTLSWDLYSQARLLSTEAILEILGKADQKERNVMYTILPPLIHAMNDLSKKELEKVIHRLQCMGFFLPEGRGKGGRKR